MTAHARHVWIHATGTQPPTPGLLIDDRAELVQVAMCSDDGHLVVTWRRREAVRPA